MIAVCLVLPSCAQGSSGTAIRTLSDLDEPLQKSRQVERLREAAVRQCMTKAGFKYTERPVSDALPGEVSRLGFSDKFSFDRQGIGYGISSSYNDLRKRIPEDPNGAERTRLSKEDFESFTAALWGSQSTKGCYYMAEQKFSFQLTKLENLIGRELAGGWKKIETDPLVRRAVAKWSGCMKLKGYEYETPWGARAYFTNESVLRMPRVLANPDFEALIDRERLVSRADLDCWKPVRSDVEKVVKRVETEIVENNYKKVSSIRG